jgi:hypothetical protein
MPFPASNGTIPLTLEQAWSGARLTAQQIQQQANALNAQIPNGVSLQSILNSLQFFATLNAQLTQYAAVPGLAAYAQAQISNPSFDVAGAFNAMQTALVAAATWIAQNFPFSTYTSVNAQGFVVYAPFTAGQLAPLATLLTALSATID